MPTNWIIYACLGLGLSSALVGGVFKAFSEFVMEGLSRAVPAGGIESMQHINRAVLRTEFVVSLIALAPLSVAFAIYAGFNLQGLERNLIIGAALVYIPSVFLVTLTGNVPMNNRLDKLDPASADAGTYWAVYCRDWTRLNHVRTIGSISAAAFYFLAMLKLA